MADLLKVLGQLVPAAGVLTAIYTAGGAIGVTVSTVSVCNLGTTTDKVRLRVAVAGAADDPKQAVLHDVPVKPGSTRGITIGITMSPGDVVRVYSLNGNIAFNLFGVEVS